ncbi:hypothetical protein NPIL_275831 [Nephila pilipes]|uniref:Uncharacterized protein n=1 Tax=Nephila pilipes TaxID=299642 RepID=A0A8X6UIT2_NEPPI|nr:hypothetical protein NPIL_275831 [Nephila pilipes]
MEEDPTRGSGGKGEGSTTRRRSIFGDTLVEVRVGTKGTSKLMSDPNCPDPERTGATEGRVLIRKSVNESLARKALAGPALHSVEIIEEQMVDGRTLLFVVDGRSGTILLILKAKDQSAARLYDTTATRWKKEDSKRAAAASEGAQEQTDGRTARRGRIRDGDSKPERHRQQRQEAKTTTPAAADHTRPNSNKKRQPAQLGGAEKVHQTVRKLNPTPSRPSLNRISAKSTSKKPAMNEEN